MAPCGDERDKHCLGAFQKLAERWWLFRPRRRPGFGAGGGEVTEVPQGPGAPRLFQGPPVNVVAQIVAGIARKLGPRAAGEAREWRIAGECCPPAETYD